MGAIMKQLICLFWILALTLISAQAKSDTLLSEKIALIDTIKTEPVTVGFSFLFHSEILNEDRTVYISLPGEYDTSGKDYPVIYMPDGQWHFIHTTQAVGNLAGNGIIPQMIIVAVQTLDNRSRDLAATLEADSTLGGGADTFLKFMKKELIPFVEKNYRTYPFRLLCGSSFGGIFTLHGFFDDPDYFNAYLAYSPSTWWQDQYYVKQMEKYLQEHRDATSYFYINVANEGLGMGVNALAEVFEKYAPENFKWKFEEYPDEIHETTAYKATFNGLKFVFSDWKNETVKFAVSGYLLKPGDSVLLSFDTTNPVHFTLDGSKPTYKSPLYSNPIAIKKPSTIKAFEVYGHGIPGNSDSMSITYLESFKALKNVPKLEEGLNYSYYEGHWEKLPDFKKLTPIKSGVIIKPGPELFNRFENVALHLAGYIDIPEDNAYTFYLTSDDGSKLIIDDKVVIDNDGLHGFIEKSNTFFLENGKHKIEIQYFQETGGMNFSLEFKSDKIKRQTIPDSSLLHPTTGE